MPYPDDIHKRLSWLRKKPDGILYSLKTPFHQAVVLKKKRQIQLFFVESQSEISDYSLSGAMSRMDIDDPFNLLAVYTQAMMLGIIWKPEPLHILILGLGGGRLPMVFRHFFPDTRIDCVEIDPGVVDIAELYFALVPDERLHIIVQDGRRFMETLPEKVCYDIILVDCFTGAGHHPIGVSTVDFFRECGKHLSGDGVIVTNLHENDPLFARKTATFRASFRNTYRFIHEDADVFFGLDSDALSEQDVKQEAMRIQTELRFPFPFGERANDIHIMTESPDISGDILLTDN